MLCNQYIKHCAVLGNRPKIKQRNLVQSLHFEDISLYYKKTNLIVSVEGVMWTFSITHALGLLVCVPKPVQH